MLKMIFRQNMLWLWSMDMKFVQQELELKRSQDRTSYVLFESRFPKGMCWFSIPYVRWPTFNGLLLHHIRDYVKSFNNCLLRTFSSHFESLKKGRKKKERQAAEHHYIEHDVSLLPCVCFMWSIVLINWHPCLQVSLTLWSLSTNAQREKRTTCLGFFIAKTKQKQSHAGR